MWTSHCLLKLLLGFGIGRTCLRSVVFFSCHPIHSSLSDDGRVHQWNSESRICHPRRKKMTTFDLGLPT
uniref:Secreted protein n=2 Tax=Picea TaxID=3328 RepID=A0A101LXY1_PICGL|nr:hypothetical protein ABT39_MTgene5550 [Picea glauca]QHR91666.1 hypothetical protein Q903MT_gene5702 [Picea sitchensis]